MSSGLDRSADVWLQRNFGGKDVATRTLLPGLAVNTLRLYVLPLILLTSALVVAVMWYQKDQLHLITATDRIGYTLLLAATIGGAPFLKFRPDSTRLVMAVAVSTFIVHLLAAYYTEMTNRIVTGQGSSYELTVLALWLPFVYVGSFVFLSPRAAVRASIATYIAIALPQCILIAVETDKVSRLIAISMLIAQPIYIGALWVIGLLKTHTRDIHQIAKSMSEAATIDALTGIANRRAIDQVLKSVTQPHMISGRSLSVLILDVDHFKRVNDSYGHNAGDAVLVKLASEAGTHLRTSDLIGRWGGEEFVIISLDLTGQQAIQMAERLRTELASAVYPHVGTVTVSIGVTNYTPGEDIETFINRADQALYMAKHNGRNRTHGLFDQQTSRQVHIT